jgi:hypothetical protein
MLPDDAFLRKLPSTVERAEAVQLEALVFSADAVEVSMNAMRRVTIAHREKITEAPRHASTELFISAWTIVDCIHVVRQVLRAMDYQTPLAVAFQSKYESATKLRNKMDHLTGNADNLAKAKSRAPIFGAIGYVCIPENGMSFEDGQLQVTNGGIVSIIAGSFDNGKTARLVNPLGRELAVPVGGFELDAFNEKIELEQAENDLRELITEINSRFHERMVKFAEEASVEHGVPVDKIMAHGAGWLTVYLAFNFDLSAEIAATKTQG